MSTHFSSHAVPSYVINLQKKVAELEKLLLAQTLAIENDTRGAEVAKTLTKRQILIIEGLCDGRTNGDIAESIGTCLQVVKNNLTKIYDKTGTSSRMTLFLFVREHPALASRLRSHAE